MLERTIQLNMAYNILCKFCGHTESAHIDVHENNSENLPGMQKTLDECKNTEGYVPDDIDEHDRIRQQYDEKETVEMRIRWGQIIH